MVEQSVRHAEPRAIDKHYVVVNRRKYPPKQVVSAATGKPVVSFTTMEANRVLKKLGFELGMSTESQPRIFTESETLFEAYLNASGLINHSFEKAIEGTSARPDYTLWFEGREIAFEVKEFHATAEDFRLGSGGYDPYGPIRQKIDDGRSKFRDLKDHCCCLVLYNREKPLVDLSWEFIYGALLGNIAVRMPFDPVRGLLPDQSETGFFGGGGKGIRYAKGTPPTPLEPQNRTISALLVLEQMGVGRRRFDIALTRRKAELGRRLTLDEHLEEIEKARGTERDVSLSQLRVVVCENPYARISLPRELFRGPYDERYGLDETTRNCIVRLYAGEQINQLDSQEGPEQSPIQRLIDEDSRRKRKLATRDEPAGQV
jgi:hypothetical protein